MAKTPEELIAADGNAVGDVEEVRDVSTEEIADSEETQSATDAYTDADARVEAIELNNDATDQLVDAAEDLSEEGPDPDFEERR